MNGRWKVKNLSTYFIRKYVDAILKIASNVEEEEWQLENFIVYRNMKWDLSFCVMVGGLPKGYVVASRKGTAYHIHHFIVEKEQRNLGMGSMMLLEATKSTLKYNLKRMSLKVQKRNERALGFYSRHGFKLSEKGVGNGKNYLMMEKEV